MQQNQWKKIIIGVGVFIVFGLGIIAISLSYQASKGEEREEEHGLAVAQWPSSTPSEELDLMTQGEKVVAKLYDMQQAVYDEVGQIPNAIYHFTPEAQSKLAKQMQFSEWKEDEGNIIYDMAISMVIQVDEKDCYYLFPSVEGHTYIEMYDSRFEGNGSQRYFAPTEVYETVKNDILTEGEIEKITLENPLAVEITEIKDESLLVKGTNEAALKSIGDACYLSIHSGNTTIVDAKGNKVTSSYLKKGMQLNIELLGGVLESYPCQAEACIIQVIE